MVVNRNLSAVVTGASPERVVVAARALGRDAADRDLERKKHVEPAQAFPTRYIGQPLLAQVLLVLRDSLADGDPREFG